MSLEQLLKDNKETSAWTFQRRKLIRFLAGLGIMFGGLIVMAALVLSTTGAPARAQLSEQEQKAQADSLAELMQVQKQAAELKEQVESLREQNSAPRGGSYANPATGYAGGTTSARPVNYDPGTGFVDLKKEGGEVYVPTGAVFQAQLITPIKTSVERTFVMAEVTADYRMDMKRRIPKGSRLIGRSRLNPTLKGVIVEFETLVLPNGIETSIAGLALSRNALPEIEGLYFSDKGLTYGTALAFGFLSGFADAARTRQISFWGSVPEVTLDNQVLAGLSTASFQVANEILNDIRQSAVEYVVVPAGEMIFVALTRRYDVNQKGNK